MDNHSKYLDAQRKLMRAAISLAEEQCGTRTERPEPQITELVQASKEFYVAANVMSRGTATTHSRECGFACGACDPAVTWATIHNCGL